MFIKYINMQKYGTPWISPPSPVKMNCTRITSVPSSCTDRINRFTTFVGRTQSAPKTPEPARERPEPECSEVGSDVAETNERPVMMMLCGMGVRVGLRVCKRRCIREKVYERNV